MTKHYTLEDINNLENFFRRYLMNTVTGFKSGSLIGTRDVEGNTNLAIFSSLVHIGANPPLMGFVMRPTSVERHTYENIKDTGFFSVNQIHKGIYKQAHQTSARYPKEISEFYATGLTEQYSRGFSVPYVMESKVKFGLSFEEEHAIKVNNTTLIIGKIQEMFLPENIIEEDGFVDLNKAGTVAVTGLDCYHLPQKLGRLSYAKPDKPLDTID